MRALLPNCFDRYLFRQVLSRVLAVWLLLLLLLSTLELISEIRDMRGDYQFAEVLWYNLMTMAYRAYTVFPFAALVGTLLAVGKLSDQQELVIMRTCGCSRRRLAMSALLATGALLAAAAALGEVAGRWLEPMARDFRVGRITGQVSLSYTGGLWLRDGDSMVHIEWPAMLDHDTTNFSGLNFYQRERGRLCRWLQAAEGELVGNNWVLKNVTERGLCGDRVRLRRHAEMHWPSRLSNALLANLALRPSQLSVTALGEYIRILRANDLESLGYEIAYFQRLYYPVTVLTLIWLALPLVFDATRWISRGRRLLMGIAAGILLYICYKIMESLTGVYELNPAYTALLPALLSLLVARVLYRVTSPH